MNTQPDRSPSAHWSKDYVEHLRTVHFTLVAVCIGLIVLSTSRSPTVIQIAHKQILEIQEIAQTINEDWFDDAVVEQVAANEQLFRKKLPDPHGWTAPDDANTVQFQEGGITKQLPLAKPDNNYVVRPPAPSPDVELPETSYRYPRSLVGGEGQVLGLPEDFALTSPLTLTDFHKRWDFAGGRFDIDIPLTLSDVGFVRPIDNDRNVFANQYQQVALSFLKGQTRRGTVFLGVYQPEERDAIKALSPQFSERYYYGCVLDSSKLLTIPIRSTTGTKYDAQAVLISHAGHNAEWRHGAYIDSFRQLYAITKNYEDLPIKQIVQIIADEEKRTGDSFEALGIKFPAENTTRWGVFLIVGIQIYLWIHLRELSPKIGDEDPGWDVAWIGVYQSLWARGAMFVSLCVLPCAAALAMGIRGLQISSFAPASWVILSSGVLGTLVLGGLAWPIVPSNLGISAGGGQIRSQSAGTSQNEVSTYDE
jgi:hypothetical protein